MIPLADYPSIVLGIIHLYAIGSVIIETPRAIPGHDGSRFPSGIYRIGREGIQREGILINVKLEVRSIEEGSGSGIGSEDRICLAGTSVISLDCPPFVGSIPVRNYHAGIELSRVVLRTRYPSLSSCNICCEGGYEANDGRCCKCKLKKECHCISSTA